MIDPEGVMDGSYAKERQRKKHLIFRYKVRAKVVAEAAERFLGKGKPLSVLDFGSAEGLTLIELAKLIPDARYLGIEYSDSLLACVPQLPPNIRIIKGDVTKLPKEADGQYDLISALAVLEHLEEPKKSVLEAARLLRPGGIFVATCPNPFWEKASSKLGLLKGDHHSTELSLDTMAQTARACGLNVLAKRQFMLAAVTFLPYLGLNVSPSGSLRLDDAVSKMRVFNFLFTNQCVVAEKPL